MDVIREQIRLLWSTVGETVLAKGVCSNMKDSKYQRACRRTKLPGRHVHCEVREIGKKCQRRSCDRQSTVCGLFQIKSDFIKTRPKSPPPSWHNQSMLSGSSQAMGHEAEHGSWHTLENGRVQLWRMHMPSDDTVFNKVCKLCVAWPYSLYINISFAPC